MRHMDGDTVAALRQTNTNMRSLIDEYHTTIRSKVTFTCPGK